MKIYLDTSVISYLSHIDAPEKMADTLKLWEKFKEKKFDIYVSTLTINEINKCYEPKRTELFNFLKQIEFTVLDITQEALDIAKQIIELKILTKKSFDDCQHIGVAVAEGCDCIISWNFKHIVNLKTIHGVRAITSLKNYKQIDILNPSILLGGE